MKLKHLFTALLALTTFAAPVATHAAESYPGRPVRLIIGYAPGGGSDLVGRMAGEQLTRRLGGVVVVENIAGAAQNIAAARVAQSAPDGHTILMSTPALTINPWMYKETGYKLEGFAPVALFGQAPNALVIPATAGINTPADLVGALKAKRTGNFSSAGFGTTHHLSGELFKQITGLDFLEHVPYKSAAEALTAALRNDVQLTFVSVPSAKGLAGSDKVRILGLTGSEKSTLMTGVPMLSDVGLEGMDIGTWYGLLVAAGTSAPIVNRINAAVNSDNADFAAKLAGVGVDNVRMSPQMFEAFLKADLPRWGKLLEKIHFERQ